MSTTTTGSTSWSRASGVRPTGACCCSKNDGQGVFFDVAIANVQSSNELNADDHDVEVIDLNGDSFLDLVTLHDGLNARNG